jgi:Tfp pilus assembly protein PilF
MRNASALDAYGSALLALAYIDQNDDQKADIAIKDAISSDPDDLGVRMVQAFIALKRNKTGVLSSIANDLGRDQGQRADVNYFLMALADRQQRYGDARRYFETAVLAEPAYPDVYIEQANYSIGLAQGPKLTDDEKKQNYENAKMYYNTALIARPEAEDALAGMAVVALFEKNLPDAMKFGIAARDAEPGNAAGHFVMAAIYEASRKFPEAQIELKTSWKLDKLDLEGRSIPTAVEAWKYLNTGGRVPVISTPPPPAAAGG